MSNKGKAEIIAFIGRRKSGKTTAIMKAVEKVPDEQIEVYDIHGDWERELISKEAFIDKCNASEECVFIFEDATSFFGHNVEFAMKRAMARSRNNGVTIILSFHSLRMFPLDIFEFVDKIVLFKTRDKRTAVEKKFEHEGITRAFDYVNRSSNAHANVLIDLNE